MFKYSSAQSSFIPKFLVDFFFGNMSIKKRKFKTCLQLESSNSLEKKREGGCWSLPYTFGVRDLVRKIMAMINDGNPKMRYNSKYDLKPSTIWKVEEKTRRLKMKIEAE